MQSTVYCVKYRVSHVQCQYPAQCSLHIEARADIRIFLENLKKKNIAAKAAGQTLPDATPPLGKIPPFTQMAVTFEPMHYGVEKGQVAQVFFCERNR